MAEHVRELLSAYIDNEVNRDEEELVRNHLKHCEECRESLYELELLKDNVFYAYENIEVPVGLEASIMNRIHVLERDKTPVNHLAGWMTGLVGVLILLGLAALVAPFVYIIGKIGPVFARTFMKVLHTVPIVMDAIPYFSFVLYGAAVILIIFSGWFLLRLLLSGSFDRREVL